MIITKLRLTGFSLFSGTFLAALLMGSNPVFCQEIRIEKLGLGINTDEYDEVAPLVSPDGNTLYFTRVGDPNFVKTLMIDGEDRSQQPGFDDYLRTIYTSLAKRTVFEPSSSSFNQDVWIANGDDFQFTELQHPGSPLNNALPNSICGITPNPNKFIVINQFPETGGMMAGFSTIQNIGNDTWTLPQPLAIDDYHTQSDGVSLTMSHDGEVLLLSLNRGGGYGGNDLYVSFRQGLNHYSAPKNLGWEVNTERDEITPTISEDKKTIYFASDRVNQGTDIYFVTRLDDSWTKWSSARRFKNPINSEGNDSQPHFNPASGHLYFVSNRAGTNDIYRTQILEPKIERALPQRANIRLVIREAQTQKVLAGMVNVKRFGSASFQNKYKVGETGYSTILPAEGKFTFVPEVAGYVGHPKTVELVENNDELEVVLEVDLLKTDGLITTRPIFFRRSTAEIKTDSHAALDDVVALLIDHPELSIRIEGHTDSNGGEKELIELSEKRAVAVLEFLKRQGIDDQRLTAKGFGAQKPISANDSEESREKNRRVEIRIQEFK